MFYSDIKEQMQLHPEFSNTFIAEVIVDIGMTIGNSSFSKGERVYAVVAKKRKEYRWTVYITSLKGNKDYTVPLEDAPEKFKAVERTDKDPYRVIEDNFSSHNNRVF